MSFSRLLLIVIVLFAAWKLLGDGDGGVHARELSPGNDVVMFATESCGYCAKARRYFQANDVRYREFDIGNSDNARSKFNDINGRGVPVVIIGDERIDGYSAGAYDQALSSLE